MRVIVAPLEDPKEVYQVCVHSIANECLRNRLTALENDICVAASDYKQKAKTKKLYTIPPNNCENEEIALGQVTKKELINVYSSHMVGKEKPARKAYYDLLLSRAPSGKCPFCGFGQVWTLDHYLPKTTYPQLSVVPSNLVPSCRDCNTGKSTFIATTENTQSLHPYFDHQIITNEQWLFAKVIETSPATIQFYVKAPIDWDEISKARVHSHFKDFKLELRYSLEASDQLGCLRDTLSQYRDLLGTMAVKQHLFIESQTHIRKHMNSWQTAMFQALSVSDWYCDGGFQ
ncbi:HNH endonuclease [Psychrobacter sp. JCM 18900]|uniref:HNH endonuclease n=1 Tax=Psychrobacter sp. JCM 18900 TaxID=1298608 RepID=UPI000430A836|nr:HNH endonuclease [Psychrobacter sp. JCM 18900]GAF53257.1 hypothetical protein JCM18900_11820 [Psychrobacter sp. JCM 18900]